MVDALHHVFIINIIICHGDTPFNYMSNYVIHIGGNYSAPFTSLGVVVSFPQ